MSESVSRGVTVWECRKCGHVVYPARLLCPRCASADWTLRATSGGVVTEVTVRRPPLKGTGETRLAAVASDAGVRVIARAEGEVQPGARVTLRADGRRAIATPERQSEEHVMTGDPEMRIRWQSFIDPAQHVEYFELLKEQLRRCAGHDVAYEVIGISPPDRELHRLTELRCGVRAIANAIAADRDGADAFLIGHFQDAGLHDARAAVQIPVLGLGETSMLHACMLGERIGLVTIDPIFIPWHREQIARYGLGERVIGVTAMASLAVGDYVSACAGGEALDRVLEQFERAARPLLEAGAEVLIPAGGLPALVLSREPGLQIDDAAVLNPVPVLAKHGEAAVSLARQGLPVASRRGAFAPPSTLCVEEFLGAAR